MTKRKLALWIVPAVILVIGALWLILGKPSDQVVRFSDGRQFTLRAVTYGTKHHFVVGPVWKKMIEPILPAQWKWRIGLQFADRQFDAPMLVFWGQWSGMKTGVLPTTMAAVADESGEIAQRMAGEIVAYASNSQPYVAWNCPNYPRRNQRLHFHLYEMEGQQRKLIADLKVRNPGLRRYPVWEPAPFPITKREGDTEFALINFTPGELIPNRTGQPRVTVVTGLTAIFRVTQNGRPDDAWRVESVEVSDATGNKFTSFEPPSVSVGDFQVFGFTGTLWPKETSWKLKTEFARTRNFESNEIFSVHEMALGKSTDPARLAPDASMAKVGVADIILQRIPFSPNPYVPIRRNGQLTLQISLPTKGLRATLLSVVDERGQTVLHNAGLVTPDSIRFDLEMPPDAVSLNFSFAVQRSRFVEFVTRREGRQSTVSRSQ